jgi:hypothetical protein
MAEVKVNDLVKNLIEALKSIAKDGQVYTEDLKSEAFARKVSTIIANRQRRNSVDPESPKRPQTSFFLFCQENRETVKKEHPELKGVQITKELGRIWREELEEEDRKYYSDMYQREKLAWTDKMKQYLTGSEDSGSERSESDKRERVESSESDKQILKMDKKEV